MEKVEKVEKWKSITSVEGLSHYEISDLGNIREVLSDGKYKTIKPWLKTKEYVVTLQKYKFSRCQPYLKCLVANEFLNNEKKKTRIIHKNGDISDNRAVNLAFESTKWDGSKNPVEASNSHTIVSPIFQKLVSELSEKEIQKQRVKNMEGVTFYCTDLNTKVKKFYLSIDEASKDTGLTPSRIKKALKRGKGKTSTFYFEVVKKVD